MENGPDLMVSKEEQIEGIKAWLASLGINARPLTPEEIKVAEAMPSEVQAGYIASLWGVDVKQLQEDTQRLKDLENELQDILAKREQENQ